MKSHAANEADGSLCLLQLRSPVHSCPAYVSARLPFYTPDALPLYLTFTRCVTFCKCLSRTIRAPDRLLYVAQSAGQQCYSHADCVCPACCSQCCDLMFGIVLSASWLLQFPFVTAYLLSWVLQSPSCLHQLHL